MLLTLLLNHIIFKTIGATQIPSWYPYIATAALIVTAIFLAWNYLAWHEDNETILQRILPNWGPLGKSGALTGGSFLGVLAAGLFVTTPIGIYSFSQAKTTEHVTVSLAEDEIVKDMILSMEYKKHTGKFINYSYKEDVIELTTKENSLYKAIYRAKVKKLPGELIAKIGSARGELLWKPSNKILARTAIGTVEKVSSNSFTIRDIKGEKLELGIGNIKKKLVAYEYIGVIFDSSPKPSAMMVDRGLSQQLRLEQEGTFREMIYLERRQDILISKLEQIGTSEPQHENMQNNQEQDNKIAQIKKLLREIPSIQHSKINKNHQEIQENSKETIDQIIQEGTLRRLGNNAYKRTLFTRDSQLIALEKRCDPANKGSSAHSFTVPEPEMLNICPNWNLLI